MRKAPPEAADARGRAIDCNPDDAERRSLNAHVNVVRADKLSEPSFGASKGRSDRSQPTSRLETHSSTSIDSAHLQSPWLSILIPVYNVEPYLRECLTSIYDQLAGHTGVEILLLDDASTDDSAAILATFAKAHATNTRMLVHRQNLGLSAARNSLLEAAKGDYVWFVDSDDKLMPKSISSLHRAIRTSSADLILCDYRRSWRRIRTFNGPAWTIASDCEGLVRGVFSAGRLHSWSKISRRLLWGQDLRFPVGRCFEDITTTPRLLLRAVNYYYVPEAWIFYRRRSDSIMAAIRKSQKVFDAEKNNDLAMAMVGYRDELHTKLPRLEPSTAYALTTFVADHFTGLAARLIRCRGPERDRHIFYGRVLRYRDLAEDCSPVPLLQLGSQHLRRLRIRRWLKLRGALALAERALKSAASDSESSSSSSRSPDG